MIDNYQLSRVGLKGIYLKQDSVSFLHKKVVNLYISYKLDTCSKDLNKDFRLGNCLFGAAKLTENAGPYKYKYSGYGIGFDFRSQFSWTDGSKAREKMLLFLELMIVLLCILMVEKKHCSSC